MGGSSLKPRRERRAGDVVLGSEWSPLPQIPPNIQCAPCPRRTEHAFRGTPTNRTRLEFLLSTRMRSAAAVKQQGHQQPLVAVIAAGIWYRCGNHKKWRNGARIGR